MKVLFSEIQGFRNVWWLLFFIPLNGLFIYAIIKQLIMGRTWGTNPAPDWVLLMIELFILLFTWWFWNIKLVVKVYKDTIKVKFHNLMIGDKTIGFNEIEHFRLKEYDAFREYGGWGLRGKKHKKAYTVSGKHGIQLLLKNGKMILIGTQNPKRFAKAIEGRVPNQTTA